MSAADQFLRICSARRWLFSIFLALGGTSLASGGCAPPPIPVHIGNVTLSNQNTARGLSLSVGNPPQPFAFMPQWPLNNSFLYGTNGFCHDAWSDTACVTFHGGQYDELESTTRQIAVANSYPNDTGTTGVGNLARTFPPCDYITDNFTLNANVSLGEFPLGIALANWGEQPYHAQMAVGLGSNSTLLNALKSSGQIASRTWSMYWGRTGGTANTQQDGAFIFGGYDRAKVTGRNYTQALSFANAQCATQMLVSITDIVVNFPNGTDKSLMKDGPEPAKAMPACILPDYPTLLTIPFDPYFQNFADITDGFTQDRSFGLYYFGMLYDTVEPFKGDISITLDSGLTVRIPNDQLVVPDVTLDQSTGAWAANISAPELILDSNQAQNLDDLPQLGRQFLSAAYLMLNQDAGQFTLWEVNPTPNEDLVAVDNQNNVVEELCAATTTNSTNSPPPTDPPSNTGGKGKKLSAGAIAGIVIGSVAFIAALVTGIFFFLRRKRNSARNSAIPQTASGASELPYNHTPQELAGRASIVQPPSVSAVSELPSFKKYSPPPQELSA